MNGKIISVVWSFLDLVKIFNEKNRSRIGSIDSSAFLVQETMY